MTDNNKGDYAVLFVDDEEKALKYFDKAVGGRFPVLTASDVDSALNILQEEYGRIAVVVSDQRMPGKNGVELLKYVRQHHPGIVRLLTTAYSDLDDAIEAINRGEIYRYIQKPWHVESLQAEVAGAMHYFLLRRERDLLLAEKLSARQRMTDVQRLSQLIVYAQTLQRFPHVDYGLQNFLELLSRLPGARESDSLNGVDQWELTRWESRRSSDFFNALQPRLGYQDHAEQESLSADQIEHRLHQAAGGLGLELSVAKESGVTGWKGQGESLQRLLTEVCGLLVLLRSAEHQVPVCNLARTSSPHVKSEAIALTFSLQSAEWPADRHLLSGSVMTDVNPVYQHAFAISLWAAALQGCFEIDLAGAQVSLRLVLPVSKQELVDIGWEWQTEALSVFEPAIEEFYPDL